MNCLSLLICTRCHTQDNTAEMYLRVQELNVSKREIHLVEIKYCEDTWPGHQLEASRK